MLSSCQTLTSVGFRHIPALMEHQTHYLHHSKKTTSSPDNQQKRAIFLHSFGQLRSRYTFTIRRAQFRNFLMFKRYGVNEVGHTFTYDNRPLSSASSLFFLFSILQYWSVFESKYCIRFCNAVSVVTDDCRSYSSSVNALQ